MSTKTTNYNLVKPDLTDTADIGVINSNMDAIDAAIYAAKQESDDLKNGTITVTHAATADSSTNASHASTADTATSAATAAGYTADGAIANALKANATYQTATGSSTAITLTLPTTLQNGYSITFIASANNNGSATTINSKNLYKPNTTTAPNLISGKAYTVWYNSTSNCFFIKASAEGNTVASHVLAGDIFSNDTDTGIVGTMTVPTDKVLSGTTIAGQSGTLPNKVGSLTVITPSTTDQAIPQGYFGGALSDGKVKGDPNLIAANMLADMFGIHHTGVAKNLQTAQITSSSTANGTFYNTVGSTTGLATVTVSLTYLPSIIVILSGTAFCIYTSTPIPVYSNCNIVCGSYGSSINFIQLTGSAYVNAGGFCLPFMVQSASVTYWSV